MVNSNILIETAEIVDGNEAKFIFKNRMCIFSQISQVFAVFKIKVYLLCAFFIPETYWSFSTWVWWILDWVLAIYDFVCYHRSAQILPDILYRRTYSLLKWVCILAAKMKPIHHTLNTVFFIFGACIPISLEHKNHQEKYIFHI